MQAELEEGLVRLEEVVGEGEGVEEVEEACPEEGSEEVFLSI